MRSVGSRKRPISRSPQGDIEALGTWGSLAQAAFPDFFLDRMEGMKRKFLP